MSVLNFERLDDVLLAAAFHGGDPASYFAQACPNRIGPLTELLIQERAGAVGFTALPPSIEVQTLQRALTDRSRATAGAHVETTDLRLGFVLTSRDPEVVDQAPWTLFRRRAQQAAEHARIPKSVGQGLIGAVHEIESNVHLHSGRPFDGIVGYRSNGMEFEFVIADSGVGTLASLRQNAEYASLDDAGESLHLALSNGVSRFGKESGHGYGFNDLFNALANLNGELRFRSGDHALTIDGTGPALPSRQLIKRVELQGFVASVVCRF